jgi:uncharacterized protein (DUF1697 family)
MPTVVSMIRGINVGGNRMVKMERLRALFGALGLGSPRTYLQSGNVVCEATAAQARSLGLSVERRMARDLGFEVSVVVRTASEMTAAVAANPLAGRAGVDPQFLHAVFLVRRPAGASLDGPALPFLKGEIAELVGDTVYLYCPNGYGVSKISNAYFERRLGARATARNWRTVTALEELARAGPPR